MGRIADVLNELTLLGAVGNNTPVEAEITPTPKVEEALQQQGQDEEPAEDYDPVALLTAGFREPIQEEALAEEEAEDTEELEEDAEEDIEDAEESDADIAIPDDEDSEEEEEGEDAEEEVDLAETVSRLLKEVEALAEQMNSVLWAVRELDALMKGDD